MQKAAVYWRNANSTTKESRRACETIDLSLENNWNLLRNVVPLTPWLLFKDFSGDDGLLSDAGDEAISAALDDALAALDAQKSDHVSRFALIYSIDHDFGVEFAALSHLLSTHKVQLVSELPVVPSAMLPTPIELTVTLNWVMVLFV